MIKSVELTKCGEGDDVFCGLHAHLIVNGRFRWLVFSREEFRVWIGVKQEKGELLPEEVQLCTTALNQATWLPERRSDSHSVIERLMRAQSLHEASHIIDSSMRELMPKFTLQRRRLQEAERRFVERVPKPVSLDHYQHIVGEDTEILGIFHFGAVNHVPVRSKSEVMNYVVVAIEQGSLTMADSVHMAVLLVNSSLPEDGHNRQLPEGFTEFIGVGREDRLGRLVDKNGQQNLVWDKFAGLQCLTDNHPTSGQYSPEKLPDLVAALSQSALPFRIEATTEVMDLGDGYKAKLTYYRGRLVDYEPMYDGPPAPAPPEVTEGGGPAKSAKGVPANLGDITDMDGGVKPSDKADSQP